MNTEQMTLLELSNRLPAKNFEDIFNLDIESDILDIENSEGSIADFEGDEIIYFKIIKLDITSDCLNTIVEIQDFKY